MSQYYEIHYVDQVLQKAGHTILRLPPNYPDHKPIELVWASLKQYTASKNVTFTFTKV